MSAIMYHDGNAHFDQWVDSLATTTLPQAQSRLVTINWESGKPEGYCCMGQACTLVPGLSLTVNEEDTSDWADADGSTVYDEVGWYGQWSETAPPELLDHLGISHDASEHDIYVDLPEEYAMTQGKKVVNIQTGEATSSGSSSERRLGCSVLNDTYDLTFSQIADVLRYFGIKDTVLLD